MQAKNINAEKRSRKKELGKSHLKAVKQKGMEAASDSEDPQTADGWKLESISGNAHSMHSIFYVLLYAPTAGSSSVQEDALVPLV